MPSMCEGETFRKSLTHLDPEHSLAGKPSEDTDTFRGRFFELVPYQKIVEVVEFESQDSAFAGQMRMTVSLADGAEGTKITILCEENERGCEEPLQKLPALIE